MLPLPREDMRADMVHSLDAEMRNFLQKPSLMTYKKAKMYTAALQKSLFHEKQRNQ